MRLRTSSLAATFLLLAQLFFFASPAHAAQVMHFQCEGTFVVWPTTNGTGSCHGTALSVGTGPTCAPACTFDAYFTQVRENCVGSFPPPTGTYVMDTYVNGSYSGTYRVERTGSHVDYYPAGSPVPAGEGEIAFHPPIGTCAAPTNQAFTLTGRILTP